MRKIKVFRLKCPECPRIIEGFSIAQNQFNLRLHLEKHERNKKKEAKAETNTPEGDRIRKALKRLRGI